MNLKKTNVSSDNTIPDSSYSSIGAESEAAKLVKRDRFFSVVIGNPPYSGSSSKNYGYKVLLMNIKKTLMKEKLI